MLPKQQTDTKERKNAKQSVGIPVKRDTYLDASLVDAAERIQQTPHTLSSNSLRQLQRVIGNQATIDLMRMPTTGARLIQRTIEIKKDMPDELKGPLEFLNAVEESLPRESYNELAWGQIDEIQKYQADNETKYDDTINKFVESIIAKLPPREEEEKPTELDREQQNIHSIWIEGDYKDNDELKKAMKTREESAAAEWRNLIWVYTQGEGKEKHDKVAKLPGKSIQIGDLSLYEVGFKEAMLQWEERPSWVDDFLTILDILLEKKSYVAMSDIMRMIILYYQGGLYTDVKITLETPDAKFFDEPLVNVGKLQLVDGGSQIENWAMIADAGSEMIEMIMQKALQQLPSPEQLKKLPENYADKGEYSGAHAELHENKGPWNVIEKNKEKVDVIGDVNASLRLKNPRPVNSWAHNDKTTLDDYLKKGELQEKEGKQKDEDDSK